MSAEARQDNKSPDTEKCPHKISHTEHRGNGTYYVHCDDCGSYFEGGLWHSTPPAPPPPLGFCDTSE